MITSLPRIAIAVHDFEATMRTFEQGFGMPVVDLSDSTVPDLGAHVGMCVPENTPHDGSSMIEIMAPATPGLALAEALQRFLDRRGEGLYALMLEAPDPNAEAAGLEERGLAVLPLMAGASGRDVHPASTNGVLIRVYPDGSVGERGIPADPASRPPKLSGITKAIVATEDLDKAADIYGRGFGLAMTAPTEDADRGVVFAHCSAPTGAVIELASVIDATRPFAKKIAEFQADGGKGIYSLVLQADDPGAAVLALAKNPAVTAIARDELILHGTRFLIEETDR